VSRWRVYYSDGKMVEGEGDPNVHDARGVEVIVQEHPDIGWHTQSGENYYVWRDGRWTGVDIFGLYDWLLDRGDVLFGRAMTNKAFTDVMRRALADMDGEKKAWLKREKRPD